MRSRAFFFCFARENKIEFISSNEMADVCLLSKKNKESTWYIREGSDIYWCYAENVKKRLGANYNVPANFVEFVDSAFIVKIKGKNYFVRLNNGKSQVLEIIKISEKSRDYGYAEALLAYSTL